MSRVRSAADWFSVRDPGWGRAQMGWRTLVGLVAGLATGYFAAPALGLPALLGLVFGGLFGLLPGLIVADAPAGELARHLAWYLPAFALALLLGIWLAPHKAAGLALIVVAAFLQAYLSRFGHEGHSFGIALFAFYLNGLLAPIPLHMYPGALAVAVAAVAAVFLARAVLCWYRPVRDLRRTQRAFQAACRRAAASAAGVLQGRDRASRQLRRDLLRVNTVALVFDGRLGGDAVDGRFAEYLHRGVFDVEDTLVSLAGVVVALSAEHAPEPRACAAAQMKARRPASRPTARRCARPRRRCARRRRRTSVSANCSNRPLTNWTPTSAASRPLPAIPISPSRISWPSRASSPWREGSGLPAPGRWPGERPRPRRGCGDWCRARRR